MAWLTLSVRKPRSLPMRHKCALRVRGLLCDASIYRPCKRREAEREAANRFAGIRLMLPNALGPAAASAAMSGSAPRPPACLALRLPPPRLADAQCSVPCLGRRGPSIYREGRNPPSDPSGPHMCAECEDEAEREIVLDTARGGAYYSILRQARKRLSESRGAEPRRREP